MSSQTDERRPPSKGRRRESKSPSLITPTEIILACQFRIWWLTTVESMWEYFRLSYTIFSPGLSMRILSTGSHMAELGLLLIGVHLPLLYCQSILIIATSRASTVLWMGGGLRSVQIKFQTPWIFFAHSFDFSAKCPASFIWISQRLVKEGRDQSAYYHELFLSGRPELTCAMSRLINPGRRLPKWVP